MRISDMLCGFTNNRKNREARQTFLCKYNCERHYRFLIRPHNLLFLFCFQVSWRLMISIYHLEFNLQWSSSIIELTTLDDTVTETVSFCDRQAFYKFFLLFVQTSIMHKSLRFLLQYSNIIILKMIILKCRLCDPIQNTSNIRQQMY